MTGFEKIFKFLPNHFRDYFQFLSWFLKDALGRRKLLTLLVLATGFLGVSFQIQVIGLIIYYGRKFASGDIITWAGYSLDPRSSISLMVICGIMVTVLLSLSALIIYFSKKNMLSMSRWYEEYCAKRVFYLLAQNADIRVPGNDIKEDAYFFRLTKMDSRFAGMTLRMLLSLNVPVFTFIAASAVLFHLEPVLTLIIGVLSIGYIFFQYKTSRKVAAFSVQFEKLTPTSGKKYRELLRHFKHQSFNDACRAMVERVFDHGPVKGLLDAFEGRFRAIANSSLISALFMGAILGLIIIIMGTGIIREGTGWGRLLIYVVALRFALTNLEPVFRILTVINRFYPQVHRYQLFVQSFEKMPPDMAAAPLDRYELRPYPGKASNSFKGAEDGITLARGSRLSLVTSYRINRYTMASIARSLLSESDQVLKNALLSMRFVISNQSYHCSPLRSALSLDSDAHWEDIKKWFPTQRLWEDAVRLFDQNLDTAINPTTWDESDKNIKFILSLISAYQSGCLWVMVEADGLKLLGNEQANRLLNFFQDRIVVIVFSDNFELIGLIGEDRVAVAAEQELLGIGSVEWFSGVCDQVKQFLNFSQPTSEIDVEENEDDFSE